MMRTTSRTVLILAAMALAAAGSAVAGSNDDAQGIEQAVQDYVSALYDMKPELLDGSVSPRLQKLGYMPAQDGSGLAEGWMTFAELKELCGHLNKDGMFDPETSPRKVTILDHTGMIANVKLEAAWGIDYIHLTKFSGSWMIMNVIWEMGTH
ncbi:MAG: nuclear transport factor 2 family protein [Burkholderiaceae bacterium]|nr:nuclear transport factor 2 family protein [Burkholderiaceae bacterium]